ncbi:DNA-dependent RNA polymerase [Pseudomonas phage Nerthus]|uniref:DNA-directed RNA polymerase n=1 Tax=Pseudomonas phage Nerthus TaxID=2163984 RepID=A0A2S1GMP1_9CAUD|nr:RNA polymerase [Pseudomonas phage Nerthus]AWD90639.1 DNA-dependent RNA polymerase [Pseudomonas phage Nerthus]
MLETQLAIEAKMHGAGMERFVRNNERAISAGSASDTDWFRRLTRNFVKPMADGIQAYLDYYEGRRGRPSASLVHLRCMPTEVSSYIAIKTIFDGLMNPNQTAQNLAEQIGRRIEDEVRFTKLENAAPKYIKAIKESLKRQASQKYSHGHDVLVHAEKLLSEDQTRKDKYGVELERFTGWSDNDIFNLGSKLIELFANNMLLNGVPVIRKRNIHRSLRDEVVVIEATDAMEQWIEEYKVVVGEMSPAYAPCVVRPLDWTGPRMGGWHTEKMRRGMPLVKCRDHKVLSRLTRKQMPSVYAAVNALQGVEWRVNQRILQVANEARLRGLPLGLPERERLAMPPCPVPSHFAELRGKELMDVLEPEQQEAFRSWKMEAAKTYNDEAERKAKYREVCATIDQGIQYQEFERIHFVYTCDFRGRVYAQSSLISPQGGDLQKALCQFANAMALGDEGEYWFKVHGANVWGWDKLPFDERVANVSSAEFIDDCLDIAADPLTFTNWTQADSPWQFLAWCFEYADFVSHCETEAPETFLSRVAVAMDGSCSGIQHYSAMLRDEIGGKEVNLVPGDRPQDIYGAVAKIVASWMEQIVAGTVPCESFERMLAKGDRIRTAGDWESAHQAPFILNAFEAQMIAAEWLRIGVTRSLCKKPVMTLPYGSSQMTCRESMSQHLDQLQKDENERARGQFRKAVAVHNFNDGKGSMSRQQGELFASGLTWEGIGHVVVAARAAMKFIKKVTHEVGSRNTPLEWVTPTGFIVHQAIYDSTCRRVKTQMMGDTFFTLREEEPVISVNKMKSSAAPNFVHSMDASHLVLATEGFHNNAITSIAVIHDSFGTHAGNTAKLRRILTNSFVDMYQQHDVIKDFYDAQCDRVMTDLELDLPATGSLDLEAVRESKYIFA